MPSELVGILGFLGMCAIAYFIVMIPIWICRVPKDTLNKSNESNKVESFLSNEIAPPTDYDKSSDEILNLALSQIRIRAELKHKYGIDLPDDFFDQNKNNNSKQPESSFDMEEYLRAERRSRMIDKNNAIALAKRQAEYIAAAKDKGYIDTRDEILIALRYPMEDDY